MKFAIQWSLGRQEASARISKEFCLFATLVAVVVPPPLLCEMKHSYFFGFGSIVLLYCIHGVDKGTPLIFMPLLFCATSTVLLLPYHERAESERSFC